MDRSGGLGLAAHYGILAAICAVVVGTLWNQRERLEAMQSRANEQAVVRELKEFQMANAQFASGMNLGGFVAPDILADPTKYPDVGATFLPPLFLFDVRHGYRYAFEGKPPSEYYEKRHLIKPSYESYTYVARPVIPGKTGSRTFAIFAFRTGVYWRDDGQRPTPQDARVED